MKVCTKYYFLTMFQRLDIGPCPVHTRATVKIKITEVCDSIHKFCLCLFCKQKDLSFDLLTSFRP